MKKLLLHIGAPKTGTTSIQEALCNASIRGELKGVAYPVNLHPRMTNNHRFLELLYSGPGRLLRNYTASSLAASLVSKQIARSLNKNIAKTFDKSDCIILSAENFSRFSREAIQRLQRHMKDLGVDETAVIYYVRDPAASYLSLVQQHVKTSGNLRSYAEYRSNFRQNIQRWASVYGDRLIVRPYDRALLHDHDVVEDFILLAEEFFGRELPLTERPQANTTISAEGMFILHAYRKQYYAGSDHRFRSDTRMLTRILQERTSVIDQNKPVLKQDIINIIQANHQEDLAWLVKNWCPDFPISSMSSGKTGPFSVDEASVQTVDDILATRSPELTCQLMRYIVGNTDRHWLAVGHTNRPRQALSLFRKLFLVPFHLFRRWWVTRLLQYRLWKLARQWCH